jgi:hypothetical protein
VPIDSNFAWANQGACTTVQRNDSVLFTNPGDASSTIASRDKAQLAATFTITLAWSVFSFNNALTSESGLVLSDGTKKIIFSFLESDVLSRLYVRVGKFNTATSFNADTFKQVMDRQPGGLLWAQIIQDASNLTFNVSAEGRDWVQVAQIGATSFLTSTRYGYFIRADVNTPTAAIFYNFTETNP